MSSPQDWNTNVIAEFRANQGRVGGPFEGAPMVLVHHRGRKTGRELVSPMMYLPDEQDRDTIYVFASKAGAPTNPDWYYNLVTAGQAEIERGTEQYPVVVGSAHPDLVHRERGSHLAGRQVLCGQHRVGYRALLG